MKLVGSAAIALTLASPVTWGDQGPATGPCMMLNNRVLGPRTENRPLPLMKGDAEHGFTPACSVPWNVLSPKNDPLPVDACFRGSLLQLPSDNACGPGTGKLWISSRWVVTSDDLARGTERAAVCQQLETGAWAGTRAFSFECKPRTRELAAPNTETPAPDETGKGVASAESMAGAKPASAGVDTSTPPKNPK